jgi:hypothetical protein
MVKIELEIENFRDIVLLAHNMRDAFRELETELLSNEMDVNNLIRGYICFYTNFVFFNRRYPWNQLLICIDIKKYEINKQSEQA